MNPRFYVASRHRGVLSAAVAAPDTPLPVVAWVVVQPDTPIGVVQEGIARIAADEGHLAEQLTRQIATPFVQPFIEAAGLKPTPDELERAYFAMMDAVEEAAQRLADQNAARQHAVETHRTMMLEYEDDPNIHPRFMVGARSGDAEAINDELRYDGWGQNVAISTYLPPNFHQVPTQHAAPALYSISPMELRRSVSEAAPREGHDKIPKRTLAHALEKLYGLNPGPSPKRGQQHRVAMAIIGTMPHDRAGQIVANSDPNGITITRYEPA